MSRINYFKLLLVLFLAIFFAFVGHAYQNKAFSPHFVDEDDNFVLGKYLLNDEKVYQDLFAHHQPFAYILSAGIQQQTEPNSLYLLVKRHREFVIFWSFIWAIFLTWRFGLPMFFSVVGFELVKIYLFGNLFLSESLVVFPFLYLCATAITGYRSLHNREAVFVGICFGLSMFLLAPLWPVLLVLGVLLLIAKKRELRKVAFSLLGFVVIALLITQFISIPDYLHDAFYINFKYYIPQASKDPWVFTLSKALLTPVLSLFSKVADSQILPVMKVFSVILIINLILLIKKDHFKLGILIVLILGLTNIRYVEPGVQYYSGFHILSWFITLICFSFFVLFQNWQMYKNIKVRAILVLLLIVAMWVCFDSAKKELFIKHDLATDFYVNFSRQFDFGEAIRVMKVGNDTLFVVPDEWLVYWQADILHRTKMLNYYAWMTYVPELNGIVEDSFKQNPPTFFYCDCKYGYFGLEKYWNLYQPMYKDGKETRLLVLKSKIKNLTPDQLNQLKYYNFTVN